MSRPETPTTWRGRLAGALSSSGYLATDLWIAIPAFTIIVTGLALSVGLAILFVVALPFAWVTMWSARALGVVERWRLWAFLDRDVPGPTRRSVDGWYTQLKADIRDRNTWRHFGHAIVQLPAACVTFTAVAAAWAVPFGLIASPAFIRALPSRKLDFLVGTVRPGWVPYGVALGGLVLLPLSALFVRYVAGLRARMSEALLAPSATAALSERVTELETTRSRAMDATETERRRIERDLHDGAQQRLIALAMDLGMAREKLASDPEQASALIDEAHSEAKRAIVELRDLARGIHPAVLTDRGLQAAVESIASRSSIPVDVRVELTTRPPATVEGIAYFVVTEALANVTKHARATTVQVAIARQGDRLVVQVTDDGVGGADPAAGTGLAGLADRVAAVDGWLHLASPAGGPTTLTVELPCAS